LTYASAGSQFGYRTLFLMLLITVARVVVQGAPGPGGGEGANCGPVDHSLGAAAAAEPLRSEASQQSQSPDLDADQVDAAIDRGQVDVCWPHQLNAVCVNDLAVQHIVGERDVCRVAVGYDPPRVHRATTSRSRPTGRPAGSLTTVPRSAASEISEPSSAREAALSSA